MPDMEEQQLPKHIEWDAYERIHIDRTADWFWGVGLSALALAIVAILIKNILFAIVVVLSAFALTLRALKIPKIITYALTRKGIIDGNVLYPYSELEAFWVDDESPFPKIIIRSSKTLSPLITIPLGPMDPEIVHNFLINFIDTERIEESNSQKILEYLGF